MKRAAPLVALYVAVGFIVGAWILATPPSGGPDEPSHVVRGAALVRGELDGQRLGPQLEGFALPAHVGFPDPACFAFQVDTPATCATSLEPPAGTALLPTRSIDYPVWGHVAAGFGSFLPAAWSSTGARVADALVPLMLLALSLFAASRHGWQAAGGLLVALTVPVWFIVAVVNPSGLLIAGGIAMWTAAANGARGRPHNGWAPSRVDLVLIAVGWSALVLPRRDGLIYAVLIASLAILIFDVGVHQLRRRLPAWVWVLAGASTLATLAWAATSSSSTSMLLFAAPMAPVVAIAGRWAWRRAHARWGRGGVAAIAVLGVVATLAGSMLAMARRGNGFSSDVLQRTIGQTGVDLRETIGVVGWLDTAVPESMVFLWVIGLGLLVAGAVISVRRRTLIGAAAILGVGVWASWVLTMVQNDTTGTYWQGRYYLPLLVGVPIVLSTASIDRAVASRLARAAGAISLVVLNVGFAAAMRRWGVGQSGSLMPWRWDTYHTVVPPMVLLGLHLVGTGALWRSIGNLATPADVAATPPAPNDLATSRLISRPPGVNLLGYHGAASGLGVAVRRLRSSLEAAGVTVSTFEVDESDSPRLHNGTAPNTGPIRSQTLAVVTALELPAALEAHPSLAAVDRVIGYWFWELGDVPDTHRRAFGLVDEVWAPTTFIADAYRGAPGAPPVVVQPLHLAQPFAPLDRVAAARERLAPNDEFVFLTSLDLFSIVERKNPFDVVSAFAQFESGPGRSAQLVVKTLNGDQRPAALQRIAAHVEASGVADRVTIIDEYVDDDDMTAFVAAADCLVSLHRGEGLGLPLADAMWLGTPVIATRWSGNLDFMDDTNSLLVDATLVPVTNGEGAYPDDLMWAQPDIAQAAAAMRRLVDEPAFGSQMARRATESMAALPDSEQCGSAAAAALGGATVVA